MNGVIDVTSVLARVQTALEENNLDAAIQTLELLRSPDQADVFAGLDESSQLALLTELNPATSADIFEEMEDEEAAELMTALPPETASRIVDEMDPDEAADVLGVVESEQARLILSGLEDPDEIHPLLLHPDDSAGGLMTSEFLALRRRMTVGEALDAVRRFKPDAETVFTLFVVDRYGQLCGAVNIHQLIVADPTTPIADMMETDVISVPLGTDQEACARLMSRYDLLYLPVVNAEDILKGVITADDVMDVIEDEATEDIQRFGGAEPLDQPYLNTSVLTVTRKRIGWLMLLFVTESLTGTVLRHFEGELQQVVALAFFVPLLIGTGGNAGSQTTSTIIRALAVGDIQLRDGLFALWHELRVGLLLGAGMALFAYIRALTWGAGSNMGLTVAMSIIAIVLWANTLGAVLPLLAARLKIDPTVVSGPVMSTLVDATGLFIYFTVARLLLRL